MPNFLILIKKMKIYWISIFLFIVSLLFQFELGIIFSLILIVWISFRDSLDNVPENIVFILFNLMLLFFISGKVIIDGTFNNSFEGFSNEVKYSALTCIYISHISIYSGFYVFKKINSKVHKFNYENYTYVFKILFFIFIVSSISLFCLNFEKILFVNENGYLDLYTKFNSNLPKILMSISGFFYISFFSLINFPMRIKTKITISFVFLLNSFVMLFTGQRSHFGINLLILFVIFTIQYRKEFKNYLTKKNIVIIISLATLVLILFQAVSVVRNNEDITFNNINPLKLIYNQGSSSNVIAYTILCEDQLDNELYSLATVKETIENNRIIKNIFHTKSYQGNTYEIVKEKSYLSYDLSYLILGQDYFNGQGLGTSYIAEIYKDFSYIGLFIFGILIAFMCLVYNRFLCHNFFTICILLNSLRYFLFLPRWDSLYFAVVSFQSMSFIVILALVYFSDDRINFLFKRITGRY